MKKLMIAALAIAAGSAAFAECKDLTCPFAYRIKLAGKTVTGLANASNTVTCTDGKCWVKPTSLRIAGYFYGEGETTDGGTGTCGPVCKCKEGADYVAKNVFWDANKREVKFTAVDMPIYEILRNSGAQNKAQILITLDGLNLAGFGTFNPKTANLKSANGFFAGQLAPATCTVYGKCGDPDQASNANVFDPCDLATAVESKGSIAYGRWNLAYKSDKVALAQKLSASGSDPWETPGVVKPANFVPAN